MSPVDGVFPISVRKNMAHPEEIVIGIAFDYVLVQQTRASRCILANWTYAIK